jgi:hypothetical protein
MRGIVTAILKMATGMKFFDVRNQLFLAVAIFKMAAKNPHCPISSKFDMWVDNDVSNLFLTSKNFSNIGNQFGKSLSTHISNFDDIGKC